MRILIGLGIFFAIIAIALLFFVHAAWLRNPDAGAPVTMTIEDGESGRSIRSKLADADLVSDFGYRVYGIISRDPAHPLPGTYEVRRGSSYHTIARMLALGPPREELTIKIIEGMTIDEINELLAGHDVDPTAFTARVGRSKNLAEFDRTLAITYEFLKDIPAGQSLEGYLFPDTYRVWKDDLPDALVQKQLREFLEKVFIPLEPIRRESGLSWHDVVTLASIVEAEVQTPEDRRIVAGIFLNRLANSMRIQSDATLNYVIGQGRTRATAQDLQIDSPYNSYTNDGLPPGPILNPGADAIRSVLQPTDTNYFFFLTGPDGDVYYASTYEGHLRNKVQAYGS